MIRLKIKHTTDKRYPAISLVEVLVVLALVATTMIAATQVSVSALIKIKENEVDDYVNGLMVRALEAAKSPQSLTVDNSLTGLAKFQGSYILILPDGSVGAAVTNPTFKQQSITLDKITAANCNVNSPNYVKIPNLGSFVPPAVCLQAIVQEITGINSLAIYQITVRAVYNPASGPVERELVGYRRTDTNVVSIPIIPPPPPVTQTLTINIVGNGSATVSGSDGKSCTATCQLNLPKNTVYKLTVTPTATSGFITWAGDCDAGGNVTMSVNRTCTANICGEKVVATSTRAMPVSTTQPYQSFPGILVSLATRALVIRNVTGGTSAFGGAAVPFTTVNANRALGLAVHIGSSAGANYPTGAYGVFSPNDNAVTSTGVRMNMSGVTGSVWVAYADSSYGDNTGSYTSVTLDAIACQ